jgi:hypothetical protein
VTQFGSYPWNIVFWDVVATSVATQQTTRRHIPEDDTIHERLLTAEGRLCTMQLIDWYFSLPFIKF